MTDDPSMDSHIQACRGRVLLLCAYLASAEQPPLSLVESLTTGRCQGFLRMHHLSDLRGFTMSRPKEYRKDRPTNEPSRPNLKGEIISVCLDLLGILDAEEIDRRQGRAKINELLAIAREVGR
ncbi:MAG: hypothetical protein EOM25_08800 [Deltaproteobacteria bacterium]|nr:hypothetical protein [Deltaproteobacteria bacterium]